ncbi:TPA: EscT/YscT/HrcT family type III secretion system export apparatus protein [Escherichia coli]|nr:EscT/YscT/HrcT family type III secretion system export apparatus protein [Escherichia coli]HBA9522818.1 EscT/YscT/HrcT family type III secretion system export apparatus protein [Escherichia coli]HBA9550936.1 EscT/YscT/HrcT family type III secretion system export apparatus protein [Escherichia coli]HBA9560252.1 EscT/YscT/HrcT family type III secretion system export apparatus protein [Escherichia coli]
MTPFYLYFAFEKNIFYFFLVYARVAVVFFILPVFGSRVLSNVLVKNAIITLTIIGLWPIFDFSLIDTHNKIFLICNEALIGTVLALIACIPFWVASAIGELIDNQRGATISDSIDPVHGIQSSIFSGMLTLFYGALFFSMGGGISIITILSDSYMLFPLGAGLSKIHWAEAGLLLDNLIKASIILASPVMMVMMFSEILLGILSKYCPQLNPFSLSLTVKSILAFSMFLLYGFYAIEQKHFNIYPLDTIKYFLS